MVYIIHLANVEEDVPVQFSKGDLNAPLILVAVENVVFSFLLREESF